jgi:hypothetical protein
MKAERRRSETGKETQEFVAFVTLFVFSNENKKL